MSLIEFFFASRRRHTRYWRDWSSDVCSSDLRSAAVVTSVRTQPCMGAREEPGQPTQRSRRLRAARISDCCPADRKSVVEGKSVDLGGRRTTKKKKNSVTEFPYLSTPSVHLLN